MRAPGHPGIAPTWSSSAKDMVGCALGSPRLWFTTGYGILNEVYYPRADIPQIRDLGFIVGNGEGFWVELKRFDNYRSELPEPGIPAVEILHQHPRFSLRLRIAPDPERDVLLIEVTLEGEAGMRPYALLAPHLGGTGNDNTARVDRHRGRRILWAEQGPFSLALAAADEHQRDAWGMASAGYVGNSDGWQDFSRNGALTWRFDEAGPGNVSLIGELPRRATLALGFGTSRESAATLAFSALAEPFEHAWQQHVSTWREWQGRLQCPGDLPAAIRDQVAMSAMVLRVHRDKIYSGAMVASLSIPWGNSHDDVGGYHLVWPRDLVESAGALLALGDIKHARSILCYLIATQNEDGHWSQNQWLGGKPFWGGLQLDETAFPVLLAAALAERGALDAVEVLDMTRRALGFIASNGPCTDQDRWEEDAGINTFTLAICIAALVGGARFLDEPARGFALALADYWNSQVEIWTSARDTEVGRKSGVAAHYVRMAPRPAGEQGDNMRLVLPIKNLTRDPGLPAQEQIGTDFLQLVRFGLRRADDPLIRASVKVVDDNLKVETPNGAAWRRYTRDGYGEHEDGSPFDGTGQGRPWPLLAGERGHYELAAGADPLPYLKAMAAMAGRGGLLPEQVWDAAPIPERNLHPGKPTGSAMPLAWAHAEFIKLVASRALGKPFDALAVVWERYRGQCPAIPLAFWSRRLAVSSVKAGQMLGVLLPASATVHWGVDGWREVTDTATRDTGLGIQVAELPVRHLAAGQWIDFTFRWSDPDRWEAQDFRVNVV
jgi:glucoamylase